MKKLKQFWSQIETPQKIAYCFGYSVMLTGLAHLIWYLVNPDAALEGAIGFRKPMVFGLSAGFTLVTMGWLLNFFKRRPRLHTTMMSLMSAALVVEIIIIDGQRFRGLPSHFNLGTPLDSVLWSIMGLSILVFALVATTQAALSFGELTCNPSMNLAIRTSMLLFFFSQISGQLIVSHGMSEVLVDGVFLMEKVETSTTVGEAGNLKLPHALSLHSIQAIPFLGLSLMAVGFTQRNKIILVCTNSIGFAILIAAAQLQAFGGKALLDLSGIGVLLLSLAFGMFIIPYAVTIVEIVKPYLSASVRNTAQPSN